MPAPAYTPESLRAHLSKQLGDKYPAASKARLAQLVDKIHAHASWGLTKFSIDDDMLAQHIEFITNNSPDLVLDVPDDGTVHAALLAQEAERLKLPVEQVESVWKLALAHRVTEMVDDEARFTAVKDYKPKVEEPVAAPGPAAPSSAASMDAQLATMGIDANKLMPLARQSWYRRLEANRVKDVANAPTVAPDALPAERIKQFRRAEAVTAAAKPLPKGARDPATGLTPARNRA